MSNFISLNDIKYDLLKIIEPWDGVLEQKNPRPVRQLFISYLSHLQKDKLIYDFSIDTSNRTDGFTFDVNVRIAASRSPKKLKIHVGAFQHPWVNA